MKKPFIETYTLSNIQRDLLTDYLKGVGQSFPELDPYLQGKNYLDERGILFKAQEINTFFGSLLQQQFSRSLLRALYRLGRSEGPKVVVFKNMPTDEMDGENPVKNTYVSEFTMRGLSALLARKSRNWKNGEYFSELFFDSSKRKESQRYHKDYASQDGRHITMQPITLLHCIASDPNVRTYFIPFTNRRAATFPDKERDPFIVLERGDIVLFDNLSILHARHNDGEKLGEPFRYTKGLNIRNPKRQITHLDNMRVLEMPFIEGKSLLPEK